MLFTKFDNKKARVLIQKGITKEFERGLNKAATILDDWKQSKGDVKETYYALFEHIRAFDKGLERRYDGMRNSDFVFIVVQQLEEKLIDLEDLEVFSEDGKSTVLSMYNFRNR